MRQRKASRDLGGDEGLGGVESFGEVNPADLAELDAAAPPKTAGSAPARRRRRRPRHRKSKDECTPVGVDFEKRARPKLKECYATGKKKDPNLEGTVKITVEIDTAAR